MLEEDAVLEPDPETPAPPVPDLRSAPEGAVPRLLNQVAAFNYVTVPNAPTYRALMQVFYAAKQHYIIELRPPEILERVRQAGYHAEVASEEDLDYPLGQLVEWGNLLRSHDTAAVSRIDDFYRKRYLYHLTAVGEAAHRAVLEVEATVGRSGSLQTAMLVKIRDALRGLGEAGRSLEPELLVRGLHDLHSSFETLTEEANRFIGELSRETGGGRLDEERFVMYKQAVLTYISRFVEHLRRLSVEIAAEVSALDQAGIERLLAAAARSADLPPALGEADPAAKWVEEQWAKWSGIRAWFIGEPAGTMPIVERLADVAVDAVVGLTRTLGRLNERRAGSADRAADFRTLARWFSACPSEETAHELWQAAFGLYPARHFHLEEDDAERTGPGASWWEAEPVSVPVRLRTHGRTSGAGRPSPAADHSREKEWMAQRRRRERAQIESASRRLAGQGPVRLSELARLETAELDLLLALLDEVLSAERETDGSRRTKTADGRFLVTLGPPDAITDWVTLLTPRGRLRCRNYRLSVVDAQAGEAWAITAGATT